ncbi:MAG: ATP-binding protein [Muribaculaceae bacterium]|nr:ATP-binding protein [Muribaculaceae bacterium]
MKYIFKRKIYSKILDWKKNSNGETALLIQGARRIGKSTIAEEFAKREYVSYLIVDFSIVGKAVYDLFDDMSDLDFFFLRLQNLMGVTLTNRNSVIIFDEIQLCPKARQAIKHLVKDGRYDYIETGSLLSIKKNVKNILIPSEETRISMYPMDFEEFLWAVGKSTLFETISYSFDNLKPLGETVNRSILRDFRLYMLVGGMPQAVAEYLSKNNFEDIDNIKRNILELYVSDLQKIDPTGHISAIFKAIPSELSRNNLRYKVGSVVKNGKPSRMGEKLAELADSMTVNFAYVADDPNVGFSLHANHDIFKLFISDTGLFVTLAFMDRDYTDNLIYQKLLLDKLPTDLGYVFENVVAQELRSSGNALYYYIFKEKDNERKENIKNYEIDFLVSRKHKICPIEVKSSGYKAHKSLDQFNKKYSSRISASYLLYTKDLKKGGNIIYLPVYMTSLL